MDPPVRVLSLDGGGIRGISSLFILEHIVEKVLQEKEKDKKKEQGKGKDPAGEAPRPSEVFDLIGGTSTGGIIALMLGRLGMTARKSLRAYRKVAEKAFTPKKTSPLPGSPSGAYSATALEEAIRDVIREFCPAPECVARRQSGQSTGQTCKHGEMEFRNQDCTDTVVLAITKANVDTLPTLFTTYDATSAATTFFKPIRVGEDEIEFIDAGFGFNNPCEELVAEAKRRFPGRRLQILSIGTGLGDVVKIGGRLDILHALKRMATTSKQVAARMDSGFGEEKGYFRFNVDHGLEDTTLSDWKESSNILAHTRNYLRENERLVGRCTALLLGKAANRPWYIPLAKNRQFLFRDGPQRVAIDGLGGVGKTQEHLPEWSVFWVTASSLAGFEPACALILKQVGLETSEKDDAKESLRQYLSADKSGKWLLVVDNADDLDLLGTDHSKVDGIDRYLPDSDNDVAFAAAGSEVVEVPQMSRDEALQYLQKALINKALLNDKAGVKGLLKILTYLPLALAQAAAYINMHKLSVREYLTVLSKTDHEKIAVLETEFPDRTRNDGSHSTNAIVRTWIVSFDKIKQDADAAAILSFLAFIEPTDIPRAMLPPLTSSQKLMHALGVLCGYSFLTSREDGEAYDMHRLVHLACRIWLRPQPDAENQGFEAITHLFSTLACNGGQRYLAHVLEALQVGSPDSHCQSGECLLGSRAGSFLKGAEQVGKVVGSESDMRRLVSQTILAQTYLASGRTQEGLRLLKKVEAVAKRSFQENSPAVLSAQQILAKTQLRCGQQTEATKLLEHV
ncbi:acyl transferase/acyl hydrolase/lysophospholipase [Parachaetomium inaequale]|uniref:Acyl transferase/acyl hydrolase/lysophospholipase n=1 Tax=Parachaetomium inaequale TaxID=2588326 RepID=A0AAN6PEM5_9PEZI|nr:acyl transferase/acyl hydrolase/lysophospholipase [Parachaetomium inaequale]